MALDKSLSQKLSLIDDKELSSSDHSHSLSPGGLCNVHSLSPTSPGDDSTISSPSSSTKKISFGKVFGRNEQPQSISSPTATATPISNSLNGSNTFNQTQNLCLSNYNQNHRGSNVSDTSTAAAITQAVASPSSPGKTRHSSASSTGSDKEKSVRVTRKVLSQWRSVCGKKTKDLFKRWKTVPEHGEGNDYGDNPSRPATPGRTTPTLFSENSTGGPTSTVSKIKMLVKKHSQAEIREDEVDSTGRQNAAAAASTGWSVHVWATYVQRGSCEDDGETPEKQLGRDFLSDFQKLKFTHFFRHVLDMNHDDVISASDFVALNQRIRHYIEWSSECIEFHILKEVHSGFLECFLNQPLDDCSIMYYCKMDRDTRENVNVEEWLDVWGELLNGNRDLEHLPLWLQYFPKILFQVINKSGSGVITREELRAFYTMFLGIDFRVVNETLDSIHNAMTDKSRNRIDYSLFKLCFSNFLFGKYPHGPGQYLFGICSKESLERPFPIDYSALNTPKDDLEPYTGSDKEGSGENRRSVIV